MGGGVGMWSVKLVFSSGWGCEYGDVGVCFGYRGVGLGSVCRAEVGALNSRNGHLFFSFNFFQY